jgi:ribosomal protein S18 acetylase RimI-like enzyme
MLSTLELRGLRPSDREAIVRLLEVAGNFTAAERRVGVEVLDAALGDPSQEDYVIAVAEDEGRIAGYACWGRAELSDRTWDLYWIATDPGVRRRGVGTALMERAEESVRAGGGRTLLVETSSRPGYEAAQAFYAARGYREIARFRDYYTKGDDKIVLGKSFPLQE